MTKDEIIAAFKFQMASHDPLRTVQFALAFPSVPKVEDTIALELLCEGEVIGSQRIIVTALTSANGKDACDLKF